MRYVIRVVEFADGSDCPIAGQFLEAFDHEAFAGRGFGNFVPDVARAKKFATKAAAFSFWRRQSKRHPIRPDGRPNRPMTATTVAIEPEQP
jgi:hypothetical protein